MFLKKVVARHLALPLGTGQRLSQNISINSEIIARDGVWAVVLGLQRIYCACHPYCFTCLHCKCHNPVSFLMSMAFASCLKNS
jgi:hypothetical protein